jgi:hypothetical protein
MRRAAFHVNAHSRTHLMNVWWSGGEETAELGGFSSYEIEEHAYLIEEDKIV